MQMIILLITNIYLYMLVKDIGSDAPQALEVCCKRTPTIHCNVNPSSMI